MTALRDGVLVGTRPMAEVTRGELIRMMVGRELSAVFPKIGRRAGRGGPRGPRAGLPRRPACSDVACSVRAGEILGLAGLVGAGRTELARVLFGLTPADAGEIRLRGRPVAIDSPARAVALGIAYVPEDRRRHGVILEMPVAANTTLATLARRLAVRPARLPPRARHGRPVRATSSGSRPPRSRPRWATSRAATSRRWRWRAGWPRRPAVLILDEPTQGVDVGAKAEIHRLMSELAGRGLAILMISSELPEILGMSDRIAVMHGGTIVGDARSRSGDPGSDPRAGAGPRARAAGVLS